MSFANLPWAGGQLNVGTGKNDIPQLNYYSLHVPMEDWNKLTPEQQIAKFYSEGTKVFKNGSTLAPGQTTLTPANTVETAYNRDAFKTPSATPTTPQITPNATQQPQITLPAAYQAQQNGAASNPLAIPNGIQMPDLRTNRTAGLGTNWSDFLTVAHNRTLR